ncbi:MAG TPA: TolC family protein, partial [Burkholderiales bacterium]
MRASFIGGCTVKSLRFLFNKIYSRTDANYLLRLVIISLVLTAFLSPAEAETLVQAVSRAVNYFPDIHAASARREVSSALTGQARAEFFPSVNLALGEGRETSRNISTRVLGRDVTLTRQEADLSVSQLLFDGGAVGGQVRRF